ncbi:MAG: ATP-dependent DNA ligase [Sandaracinaceae bacterium]|nr:ATP-dependent DNA ligase [Sandaracinaceae bacterium]
MVDTSGRVAATRSRREKEALLAALLTRLAPDEIAPGIAYVSGALPQGRIGVGWAALRDLDAGPPAAAPSLAIREVHARLDALAAIEGAGSKRRREEALGALFARATADERRFLVALLGGELRQGAQTALVLEAAARASGIDAATLRRAAMLAGDAAQVATAALTEGEAALARFRLTPLTPILPMLASPSEGVDDALGALGAAALEVKLDGARVQIHKAGAEVRVWSRKLHDVTDRVPEIVEAVAALPARELILDGEAIALDADGRPHPFQTTMRRFGRRTNVAAMRETLPLAHLAFDLLFLDGAPLLDAPACERFAALDAVVPAAARVERRVTDDPDEAARFYDEVLARGHEGLMAKRLDAPYEAGRRGAAWLKVKPAHTLDLVVIAVEDGSGRRRGWLSNLHLAAREPRDGTFVMLGKTFKGMTDELLAWQTERLGALALGRDGHVTHVRPELVVEIALAGVQASPIYPAGLALRFARVRRYRPDKSARDAATIDEVRALFDAGPSGAAGASPADPARRSR